MTLQACLRMVITMDNNTNIRLNDHIFLSEDFQRHRINVLQIHRNPYTNSQVRSKMGGENFWGQFAYKTVEEFKQQ